MHESGGSFWYNVTGGPRAETKYMVTYMQEERALGTMVDPDDTGLTQMSIIDSSTIQAVHTEFAPELRLGTWSGRRVRNRYS